MRKFTLLLMVFFLPALMIGVASCQQQSEQLPEPIKNGNPKLDSSLKRLVQAEERGEATSFARQNNIELVDGKVRVIVECLPDRVDVATKAAGAIGLVESRYDNLLQVLVPPAKLKALAELEGVRLVRLPQLEAPGAR